MDDRRVGLDVGVDALKWARLLRRAHEVAIGSGHVPSIVRDVVAASWKRCELTGVDPDERGAPRLIDPDDAHERWCEHPLARASDLLRSVFADLLYDARHILVVSDADGCLLWSEGHPGLLRAAENIQFTPGHAWSEGDAGTNAVGTALAVDGPVQVFSAEHFRSAVHGWQCSGAPVHDPDTGRTLGVIDVTGAYRDSHPANLALVQAAARLVQQQLRNEMLERDARILSLYAEHTARHGGPAAALAPTGRVLAATPPAWRHGRIELPDNGADITLADETVGALRPLGEGLLLVPQRSSPRRRRRPATRITLMGTSRAIFNTPDGTRRLTRRHSELVALLSLHPDGLNARELAQMLYGEPSHESSVRVELHRLREILGPALATRPYRLVDVETDLATVQGLLDGDRVPEAAANTGPLLPGSSVASIVDARQQLARRLAPTAG